MKRYKDKLLDPKWQKKRLQILERDEWTCQECGAKDKTLHGNNFLVTLSKECHAKCEPNRQSAYEGLALCLFTKGFNTPQEIKRFSKRLFYSEVTVDDLISLITEKELAK